MPPIGNGEIRLGAVTGLALGRHTPGGPPPQAGQIYRARVDSVQADGSYLLTGGGQTLRLAAGMHLSVGQELLIRMTSLAGEPKFTVMRALPPTRENPRGEAPRDSAVSALQAMASRQQPLGGLLAWLAGADNHALGAVVALLRNRLNSPQELVRPDQLRSAIHDSGLLLEPQLAAAAANPGIFPAAVRGDFKLLLWRLLGQETGALDRDLEEILEGLLAHISLRQLRAVRHAENGHFYWSMEIPLAWGERLLPVSITLRRDNRPVRPDRPDDSRWEIEISLDTESLGLLNVRLFLRDQQISVAMEAERADAVSALRNEFDTLREALSLQGFGVESMVSRPLGRRSASTGAETFRQISALGEDA